VRTLIYELMVGEQGQDLIEYALLCAFIGLAAVATFQTMGNVMAATYASWDGTTQGLADPLDPQ
jgi:Flp pilus assembly pilin Flp